MKHLYFLLILCFSITLTNAQIVNFNDPDLLTYLTSKLCVDTNDDGVFDSDADFNNDGQIQLSEAQQVLSFKFNTLAHNIEDITGFENFSNLQYLEVTTIDINSLDLSVWQSLQSVRLSSNIDSFFFNNPLLTHFELQNVGFNNPLFDLTNLPNLEYVRVQSTHLTDNLIFGTHNNLEELRIFTGTFSSLNLSGMPALKFLTIDEFIGASLDISNCTSLEEFIFRYTDNLNALIGSNSSSFLNTIDFVQDYYYSSPSNVDLVFSNQALKDLEIRGANSVSISNNITDIGAIELYFIDESVNINNSSFQYFDSSLNASLFIGDINSDEINLMNIEGLKSLRFQNLSTTLPLDLSSVYVDQISFSTSSLTELNLKNGEILQQFNSSYDTNIPFICIDNEELSVVENGYNNSDSPVVIHPYCTFVLGGEYYEITGDVLVDIGTGCTFSNGPVFDLQFTVTDGENTDIFYSNNANNYSYTLPEGSHILNSQLVNLDYWAVSPSSISLNFPTDSSPFIQEFCITPNGVNNDLEITIVPVEEARPGFDTDYKIIYKNKGNTTLSGSIDFTYYDDYMNLLSANPVTDSQSTGNLSWNYTDLLPFETREILFTMTLNTPTDSNFPLNVDDVLSFTATINPVAADETEADNVFNLDQIVVNSFDPNDKTCLEGLTVTPEQVGKYVHYLIRFENAGTANAVNIVVKDVIDTSKYDVLSLVPLDASHTFYSRIRNGNEVEFIFENIQLPFDDANNDGYVLFKIATLSTLVLGDTFSNEAEIYFDFNAPIITNNETTTVQENLSIDEFGLSDGVNLFPNPVSNYFMIELANGLIVNSVEVFDIAGKSLLNFNESEAYNISKLSSGIYFVKIKTNKGEVNKQIVKH